MANLEQFAKLLESDQIEDLNRSNCYCEPNIRNCKVKVIPGKKYIKINVGDSGKYMIDEDGNIYGIKAYGVINKNHYFGTLDTIKDYWWGRYKAIMMPQHRNIENMQYLTVENELKAFHENDDKVIQFPKQDEVKTIEEEQPKVKNMEGVTIADYILKNSNCIIHLDDEDIGGTDLKDTINVPRFYTQNKRSIKKGWQDLSEQFDADTTMHNAIHILDKYNLNCHSYDAMD